MPGIADDTLRQRQPNPKQCPDDQRQGICQRVVTAEKTGGNERD
jgi:hypothetical protein